MQVPEYDAGSVVSANKTCVSIRAIADVDGDVTVHLERATGSDARNTRIEVFRGQIDVPSRKLAVITSNNEKLLETDVGGTQAAVNLFVDDKAHPSEIWIRVQ